MVLTLPYSYITPWHGANITIFLHYSPVMVLTFPDSYITPWHGANITRFVHYSIAWS